MLKISDDIEMISLLSKIDTSKLDSDWKPASEEENTLIKKDYAFGLKFLRILGVVCLFTLMVAVFIVILAGDSYSLYDKVFIILFFGLANIVYFVLYFLCKKKNLAILQKPVYCIHACAINVYYDRGTPVIDFFMKHPDDSIKATSMRAITIVTKLKKKVQLGDSMYILKLNDQYRHIGVEDDSESMLEKKAEDSGNPATICKIEERKLVNGNDHRQLQLYIVDKHSSLQLMAIADRLDVASDIPVYNFRRFYVETWKVQEYNTSVYQAFVEKLVRKTENEMQILHEQEVAVYEVSSM
ncbi:MAG: hypothetical protein Q4D51_06330 [Eubacteriales bacterium]|nr:hypothetical protein [Eubacteriales bacterium]